jgi:glycogen(starch) synthase
MRLLYALGPGDVVVAYRRWKSSQSDVASTFASHFFDFCKKAGYAGYAVSYCPDRKWLFDGDMFVENLPKRSPKNGFLFNISHALYGLRIIWIALRWRADTVIVDSGTTHWVLLLVLKLLGKKLVAVLHETMWPRGFKPTRLGRRILLRLDTWFWRYGAAAVLAVSPECERQVRVLAGNRIPSILQFRPQYERAAFSSISPTPSLERRPFRIVFAGRIERAKGVYDVVRIARILHEVRPGAVHFDICGAGSELANLHSEVGREGLDKIVSVHGRLERAQLLEMYASSHAVIVPTRSEFREGMAMVAIEAVLCGRPVISCDVVPAVEVLTGAVLTAAPDDPQSYANAILRLLDDPEIYKKLCNACTRHRPQFFNSDLSLLAALTAVVKGLPKTPLMA